MGVKVWSLAKPTFGSVLNADVDPVPTEVARPDAVVLGGMSTSTAGVSAAVPVARAPGVRIAVDKSDAERNLLPSVGARLICTGADPRTMPPGDIKVSFGLGSICGAFACCTISRTSPLTNSDNAWSVSLASNRAD